MKEKNKYTIRNISLISILTALLFTLKYAFGFIVGFEVVTLLTAAIAIFTPFLVSFTTTVTFLLLLPVVYGVGTWYIVYWFIFPIETLSSFGLKKILKKNNVFFAIWAGLWGFSIMFWFAMSDAVLYGQAYAIAQMATAVVPNLIEGTSNIILGLLIFYPFKHLFENKLKYYHVTYW